MGQNLQEQFETPRIQRRKDFLEALSGTRRSRTWCLLPARQPPTALPSTLFAPPTLSSVDSQPSARLPRIANRLRCRRHRERIASLAGLPAGETDRRPSSPKSPPVLPETLQPPRFPSPAWPAFPTTLPESRAWATIGFLRRCHRGYCRRRRLIRNAIGPPRTSELRRREGGRFPVRYRLG